MVDHLQRQRTIARIALHLERFFAGLSGLLGEFAGVNLEPKFQLEKSAYARGNKPQGGGGEGGRAPPREITRTVLIKIFRAQNPPRRVLCKFEQRIRAARLRRDCLSLRNEINTRGRRVC